jgi:Helix-turn-helix domain
VPPYDSGMDTPVTLMLSDPMMMYVIAHPLRMRIVGSLRIDGPATSAILARRLGTDSGQTSYHLRHLARHGFVLEAPELGQGARNRERWWKAAHQSTEYALDESDDSNRRDAMFAIERAERKLWDQAIDTFRTDAAQQKWSTEWQRVAYSSDHVVRMAPSRVEWFRSEVLRLMQECEAAETADPTDGAEKVLIILHTYPHRTER